MGLKAGDFVKILKNGEFFKIVQIKKIYGDCIETSHGLYNRTTLASRLDGRCIISGIVKWEDQDGVFVVTKDVYDNVKVGDEVLL